MYMGTCMNVWCMTEISVTKSNNNKKLIAFVIKVGNTCITYHTQIWISINCFNKIMINLFRLQICDTTKYFGFIINVISDTNFRLWTTEIIMPLCKFPWLHAPVAMLYWSSFSHTNASINAIPKCFPQCKGFQTQLIKLDD